MNKITRIILAFLVLAAFAGAAEKVKIDGVLMDKMCSGENKTTAAALKHTKECALMEDCVKGGYGVVTSDGKFLKFDAAGDKQVADFLKNFKGKDNIKITVEGTRDGDTLKVASIKAS